MILTLVLMIVSFLMTKSSTGSTKKGLIAAGLVGAASAYVTTQTEWGQGVNSSFNETLGLDSSWTGFGGGTGSGEGQIAPSTGGGTTAGGTVGVNIPGRGGFFESLPSWLKGGLTAGAAAVGLSSLPSWAWLALICVGLYLLLKD